MKVETEWNKKSMSSAERWKVLEMILNDKIKNVSAYHYTLFRVLFDEMGRGIRSRMCVYH